MTPYRESERVRVVPSDDNLPDILVRPVADLLAKDRAAYERDHAIPAWHIRHIDRHAIIDRGMETVAVRIAKAKREPRFAPLLGALAYWSFLVTATAASLLLHKEAAPLALVAFVLGTVVGLARGYAVTKRAGKSLAWVAKFTLNPFTALYLTGKEAVAAVIWMNGSRDWRLEPWSQESRFQTLHGDAQKPLHDLGERIGALWSTCSEATNGCHAIEGRRQARADKASPDHEAAALDAKLFARLDARRRALAPVVEEAESARADLKTLLNQLFAAARENISARAHGRAEDHEMESRVRALAAAKYIGLIRIIERGEEILRTDPYTPKAELDDQHPVPAHKNTAMQAACS